MSDKPKVYEQFDAATRYIGAYAIFKGAWPVGRVVLKYPKDGAGRLYAYVQVWGAPMVRGWASGYGYDKATAAVASAAIHLDETHTDPDTMWKTIGEWRSMRGAGESWDEQLRALGYTVQHVTR